MNLHLFIIFLLFGCEDVRNQYKYQLVTLKFNESEQGKQHFAVRIQKDNKSWYLISVIDTQEDQLKTSKVVNISDLETELIKNRINEKTYCRKIIEKINENLTDTDKISRKDLDKLSTSHFILLTAGRGYLPVSIAEGENFTDLTQSLESKQYLIGLKSEGSGFITQGSLG